VLQETEPDDPFRSVLEQGAREQVPDRGAIIGWATATVHQPGANSDFFIAPMGAKVVLTFPSAGQRPEPRHDDFTVVGYYKSGMSEYDSTYVYVPLKWLQRLRSMGDGEVNGAINQIQIKVKPNTDLDLIAKRMHDALHRKWGMKFRVQTWEQKQGPLLSAVALEQNILNILLFFIIAVAGFGILAIFFMIVVEKTRDIGILKALGASTSGIRDISLGYGLLLGVVGSGVGMVGGLLFVRYINQIEKWLSWALGRKVFDDSIYYFSEIPTKIDVFTLAWIVGGALFIAVGASVWPAQRAARLHPARSLRFE
jgi:lipoprotein-releasing system permease protein